MRITAARGSGPLQAAVQIGKHQVLSDAPESLGGQDSGAEPHDLLAAALAACTILTVTMVARRKSLPLEDVRVQVEHGQHGGAYEFKRRIEFVGDLSDDERARLLDIANKCPVHKTLSGTIRIETEAI
jgi:putative redox protein